MKIHETATTLLAAWIALISSSVQLQCAAEEQGLRLRQRRLDGETTKDDGNDEQHYGFQNRIVGGNIANAAKYEYSVNLGGCGGSLIHPDIVLTAAHCQPLYPDNARIGGSQRNNGERRSIVGNGTPHPSYNSRSQDYDFMIYKLGSPSSKTPVPINNDDQVPDPIGGAVLTTIGFGSTFEGGSGSYRLREVDVNHVNYTICNSNYRGQIEDDIMFCAGVEGGGKDTCQGDSGGPIINAQGVQVGVTSWGNGCAREGYPGVYARVSAVHDWIQREICEQSSMAPSTCANSGGTGGGDTSTPPPNTGGDDQGDNSNSDLVQPKGITIRIDITYDEYPQENAWVLYNDGTREELFFSDYGEVSTPGLHQNTFTELEAGKYVFMLMDEFWDGICCRYGRGKMEVYQLYDDGRGDELKWEHNGRFWNAAGAVFVVAEEDDRRSLKALPLEDTDLKSSPYVPKTNKAAADDAKP